ncbi:MAG: rhomboid family intramembrane serine protease [Bdellovibrionaceae bacterium]|nr:rhomboid family intramembrane serine protease [Pseudobdellovibrionaceae bacterium]
MEPQVIIKENWFTHPPLHKAKNFTIFISILLFASGIYYIRNIFGVQGWMAASYESVFVEHEYWRLWTTLLAHADLGHLMNNALLFVPLAYLLYAYFGFWFFPLIGLFVGGLTNAYVLTTMDPQTQLIGISGVVYWMGGAWFTLFLLIDHRKSMRYRFANVVFLVMMLFIPENYWPHISYMAHFVGFVFGIVSAFGLYVIIRKRIKKAEVIEYIFEESDIIDIMMEAPPPAPQDYL